MSSLVDAFADFDADIFQMGMVEEFIDGIDDVFIDEVGAGHVDDDEGIGRDGFEFLFDDGLVEEGYILSESEEVFIVIVYDHNRRAEIASDEEE